MATSAGYMAPRGPRECSPRRPVSQHARAHDGALSPQVRAHADEQTAARPSGLRRG
jgi:hypothetical protein